MWGNGTPSLKSLPKKAWCWKATLSAPILAVLENRIRGVWVICMNDVVIGFATILVCCIGVWLYAKYAGWLKKQPSHLFCVANATDFWVKKWDISTNNKKPY
jgi:hypothetical protein